MPSGSLYHKEEAIVEGWKGKYKTSLLFLWNYWIEGKFIAAVSNELNRRYGWNQEPSPIWWSRRIKL